MMMMMMMMMMKYKPNKRHMFVTHIRFIKDDDDNDDDDEDIKRINVKSVWHLFAL